MLVSFKIEVELFNFLLNVRPIRPWLKVLPDSGARPTADEWASEVAMEIDWGYGATLPAGSLLALDFDAPSTWRILGEWPRRGEGPGLP